MRNDLRLRLATFCALVALLAPALLGGCTLTRPDEAAKSLETVAAVSPVPVTPSPLPASSPSPTPSAFPQAVPGELLVKFSPTYSKKAPSVMALSAQGMVVTGIPSLDALNKRFGVKLLSAVSPITTTQIQAMSGTSLTGLYSMKFSQLQDQVTVMQAYSKDPNVLYVEPNYYVYALEDPPSSGKKAARFTPNDPYYGLQWNLPLIQIPQAWEQTQGEGITVAVVDSGVAYEDFDTYRRAPDLAATSFLQGYDFVNSDAHANDDQGHGTHVAGTIAQSTNNGVGVAGIACRATIMPVKVLDNKGNGTYERLIQGIVYAADHGAKVINMSLGGTGPSQSLKDAVDYAVGKGVVIVAATGNDNRSSIYYPAACDNVISVGAVRYDLGRSSYSNYGTGLDLMAPGGDTGVDQNGDGYADGILQETMDSGSLTTFSLQFYQGTSMATPHVSAVAALLLALHPQITPAQVQQALQATAKDLGTTGYDQEYGYGLVQAASAISYLGPAPVTPQPTSTPTPTVTPMPTWTPSSTPTRTPTPTWGPTPTPTSGTPPPPTATPTPTGTARPTPTVISNQGEMLVNGSFETSDAWVFGGARYPSYVAGQAHSGSRSMLLGIVNSRDYYSYSSIWQYVTIPPDAKRATLTFWHYPVSWDTYPNDVQIALVISDRGSSGRVMYWLSNEQTWRQASYDLTPYAGQRVRVYFTVVNNGNGRTSAMYVDDVSVQVER